MEGFVRGLQVGRTSKSRTSKSGPARMKADQRNGDGRKWKPGTHSLETKLKRGLSLDSRATAGSCL
eukprot:scaffold2663_cov256-Pinguiococcus_pyrenoidosus.AAC.12